MIDSYATTSDLIQTFIKKMTLVCSQEHCAKSEQRSENNVKTNRKYCKNKSKKKWLYERHKVKENFFKKSNKQENFTKKIFEVGLNVKKEKSCKILRTLVMNMKRYYYL